MPRSLARPCLAGTDPTLSTKTLRLDKRAAMAQVARQITSCRRCRQRGIGKPVAGEGNPDAEIVFVGEAPGRREAESGRPLLAGRASGFAGRSARSAWTNRPCISRMRFVTVRRTASSSQQISHMRGCISFNSSASSTRESLSPWGAPRAPVRSARQWRSAIGMAPSSSVMAEPI